MTILSVDFETRSVADLKTAGLYVYAAHKTTDVWCMAYAFGDEEPQLWKMGDPLPEAVARHVETGGALAAYNANFERVIWAQIMGPRYGWPVPKLEQWFCTMARACAMALPPSLEGAAAAAGLDTQKDMEGHRIMMQMCRPRAEHPLLWWDAPEKKERLYRYCVNDVVVERALAKRLRPLSPYEQNVYWLDQRVNDRGITVDANLCLAAREVVQKATDRLDTKMRAATQGEVASCSAVAQIKTWVLKQGVECASLAKESVTDLLDGELPDAVRKVLELRREAAKTSTAKLNSILLRMNADGRLRGNLFYHGAGTGRWAARGAQLHNLPQPKEERLDIACRALLTKSERYIDALLGPPLSVVSDCIRPMFVAARGYDLLAVDWSAIEARVNAWLAGQEDLVALFAQGGKVYETMAAKIYKTTVDDIVARGKGCRERKLGKACVLGGGFGMGATKFRATVKKQENIVIDAEEADAIIGAYREQNYKIVAFWRGLEAAAKTAILNPGTAYSFRGISYKTSGSFLLCRLRSGRIIVYPYPKIAPKDTPWGEKRDSIRYMAYDSMTKKWAEDWTYGGKLCENVVQATARDIMAAAMLRADAAGYKVLLTVHDEIVVEVPRGWGSLKEFEDLCLAELDWAKGCPLAVEGWRGREYRK